MTETQTETTVTQPTVDTAVQTTTVAVKKNLDFLKTLKNLFTPNNSANSSTTFTIVLIWLIGTLAIWLTNKSSLLPSPTDLVSSIYNLFTKLNFLDNIISSLLLAVKAMFYAIVICYALATISTLQFFKPIAKFFTQARFLTTVGLSFIFAQMTPDTSSQKSAMLVYGIVVFLVTSFLGIIADIRKEEYDYAKTLKMSNWRAFFEIVIRGKSDLFLDAIRQNFAIAWMMLPMVENFCRVDGGIGIMLTDQNKYFHLDNVYAIQIVVLFIGIALDAFIKYMKGLIRPDSLLAVNK